MVYLDACVIASGGLEFEPSNTLYRKRCVSVQNRVLTKGSRSEKRYPIGKVHGFKRCDKVEYFGIICFVKARRVKGSFTLMDINSNDLDFRSVGGVQNPSYKSVKGVNARRSVLCVEKRL